MPPRTCDFLRVVVDTVCCLLCLSAAILSTISNNRTVYPDSSPFLSSRVTCLWIFLFFLYGTFTIFDIFNRKQTLPAIIVDVSSLILLLPCLLWIWTELTSNSSTTKYHLYGQHLSLLRISIFSGANFLRFFLSTLCCWDNLSIKQQKHTTKADVVHGNYVKLSSQIDDNEEKKDRDDFNYFIDDNKSVEDQASAWSRFFFCWITPMLHRGYVQQKLDHNDLPHLAHQDVPHRVYSKFLKLWNHSSRPSLFVTLYRLIFWRFYTSGLLLAGSMVAGFAQPMLLHALLVHLENRVSGGSTSTNQESLTWTLQLAAALSIVSLLKSILIHQFWIQGIRCGMHTQLALSSHVLHATMYAEHGVVGSQEFDTGKLLNLLSTDSSRIVDTSVIPAFHWGTWSPFITLIVVIVNLFYLLGIPAISGVITTLLFSGLGVWIGRSIKRAAALTIAKRDLRSTLIEQMLRSIRVIKSFSYESIVKSNITLARNDEMSQQRRQQYLSMLSAAISIVGPLLTTAITFVWYSLAGGKLTASVAFASLAWYDVLRNSLQNIPWAYVATAGTMISIKRLERFFNRARTGKIDNDKIVHLDNTEMNESDLVFKLQNCTIGWSVSKEEILEQKEQKVKTKRETLPILVNVNVCINHGQFICITGPVGSGKSTLLNVLCGHLKPLTTFTAENNTLQINSNRTYAYVGQHAWLRSTTVLENITMYGERNPINKKRLRSVIDSCLLGPDLTELPNGLDTEVGSDGITLSGGQRQRIALARAVYSDRDCVLLDDVLSAVDATVRRHILNKCLVNILKKSGKTIVLVTI
jgi:ABC-type multidrug transport system fused ATPase/permease subunit